MSLIRMTSKLFNGEESQFYVYHGGNGVNVIAGEVQTVEQFAGAIKRLYAECIERGWLESEGDGDE